MLEILGELIRGAMAHSECVALFTVLLIQQWAMHIVNTRTNKSIMRKVSTRQGIPPLPEDDDDAPRG